MTDTPNASGEPDELYLDAAATEPVTRNVIEAMMPFMTDAYANPASVHQPGKTAARALDAARASFAAGLGARPDDVIFTSGGTESDNLAIKGIAMARMRALGLQPVYGLAGIDDEPSGVNPAQAGEHPAIRRPRIIISSIEHPAVAQSAQWLHEWFGFEVVHIPVDGQAHLDLDALEQELDGEAGDRITIIKGLPFTDVDPSAAYYSAVKYCYENNIFKGVTDTMFMPNNTITRGQMVTVLWRMNGSPEPKNANPFGDVAVTSPFVKAIAWAAENKLTNGITETTFAPAPASLPLRVVGEVFKTYIITERNNELCLIDKHAAHERILFEQLAKDYGSVPSQMLLVPVQVNLSAEEKQALLAHQELLQNSGVEVDDYGGFTVVVRAVPADVPVDDVGDMVLELANHLLNGGRDALREKTEWVLHSIACRAAIKAGDRTTTDEMLALAQKIMDGSVPPFCPHGRPCVLKLTRKELEKQFGRLV